MTSGFFLKDNNLSSIFITRLFSSYAIRKKVNFIKSWVNINYFLSFNVSICFFNFQKNRLKNIFSFFFKDSFLWKEIEKLFDANLIGFSSEFIYERNSILKTNFLSILLLEIYFMDFDDFLFYLSLDFNSLKNLGFLFNFEKFSSYCFNSVDYYVPLKLESVISDLRTLNNLSYYQIRSTFFNEFDFCSYFVKYFVNCRYKNHLLFGFISSKKFLFLIKNKLTSFLRSVLFFDVKEFCMSNNRIFFLGFNITCFQMKSDRYCNTVNITTLKNKISLRLNLIKRKFLNLFLFRIRFELITNFLIKKNLVNLFLSKNVDYKFWSYFFQSEASRCFRYYVIIFSDDVRPRFSI